MVIDRLRPATAESRCLEWKASGLFGSGISVRTKYRAMKAAISFADADGGFLVFGVDPTGVWVGLNAAELAELAPAKVTELIIDVASGTAPVP